MAYRGLPRDTPDQGVKSAPRLRGSLVRDPPQSGDPRRGRGSHTEKVSGVVDEGRTDRAPGPNRKDPVNHPRDAKEDSQVSVPNGPDQRYRYHHLT